MQDLLSRWYFIYSFPWSIYGFVSQWQKQEIIYKNKGTYNISSRKWQQSRVCGLLQIEKCGVWFRKCQIPGSCDKLQECIQSCNLRVQSTLWWNVCLLLHHKKHRQWLANLPCHRSQRFDTAEDKLQQLLYLPFPLQPDRSLLLRAGDRVSVRSYRGTLYIASSWSTFSGWRL